MSGTTPEAALPLPREAYKARQRLVTPAHAAFSCGKTRGAPRAPTHMIPGSVMGTTRGERERACARRAYQALAFYGQQPTPTLLPRRADECAARSSHSGYVPILRLYPPHAGHCQDPARRRQSNWWLAAGQTSRSAGTGGLLSGSAHEASGISTAASVPSGAPVQAL